MKILAYYLCLLCRPSFIYFACITCLPGKSISRQKTHSEFLSIPVLKPGVGYQDCLATNTHTVLFAIKNSGFHVTVEPTSSALLMVLYPSKEAFSVITRGVVICSDVQHNYLLALAHCVTIWELPPLFWFFSSPRWPRVSPLKSSMPFFKLNFSWID